jgi:glycerate 2-kinase
VRDPELLRRLFDVAVAAADPGAAVTAHLPPEPAGRLVVVGAGKAAAAMARAVELGYPASARLSGLVIVPYGFEVDCERIEVAQAGHPVPDAAGVSHTRRLLELLRPLGAADQVLVLLSGGGSALLTATVPGVSLADEQELTRALLASGAPIAALNVVRTHLSIVKGGGLATAALPARVCCLVVSDVPGDDLAVVASGPTMPPRGTPSEALDLLAHWEVATPPAIVRALTAGTGREHIDPARLAAVEHVLVAAPQLALEAAADAARRLGITSIILGDAIEGESREVARVLAAIARQVAQHGQPAPPPCLLLSGGETTVTIRGSGSGGPNSEFALALAIALSGHPAVSAIACDTDGVDGVRPIAGAVVTPETLARAAALGLDPVAALRDNDSHSFFSAIGDSVVTGPTRTNVNDFRAVLVR